MAGPESTRTQHLRQFDRFLPANNPTFGNPPFEDAVCRVLIARLSPLRDVDRSAPHLFLFHEVRRALPDAFIDLAFFPTAAEREVLDRRGLPYLIGAQSLRPAAAFDLVLISNAYTLELINLPYLLIRSGIPLFAGQRGPEWPILLLGGSNAMAAQAIIREDGDSLVDGIFFGEGEGHVGRLALALAQERDMGKRGALEHAARETQGLWVAGSFHSTVKAVCEPEAQLLPTDYPTLNSPEAHTAHLQINYGCPAFCSFCFEGYDRKPYREIPLADLIPMAYRIKQAQGVEKLNLYSFNFNTHAEILEMMLELHQLFYRVSLKSQRADILQQTTGLLQAEIEADKRAFTLGIEGISQRQRDFLHKSLNEEEISALLERILALKIRRVKLFYILTGRESDEEIAEFRAFVKWLKRTRRAHSRRPPRVIFSFGLLIRMPFTPLRYDRLLLDEAEWKPLIGRVKSACETNGFEFRLAFDWPSYCVSQTLAMGGYWLADAIVALAQKGYCFDASLPQEYWDELRRWMKQTDHWNDAFLGQKGPGHPFALEFVESNVPSEFLYRQYQEAQSGQDGGYCLGREGQPGRCLGCGACPDEGQRRAITDHQIQQPERGRYLRRLRQVVTRKRRLQATFFLLRLEPRLSGVLPEFLNAFVFQRLLSRYLELVDNLLVVRESLFTLPPNDQRFPIMSGETVFGLKAWDAARLRRALADPRERSGPGFEIVGAADGFTPGEFTRLHLDLLLPDRFFPDARRKLELYLRQAYLPYSLRREGGSYRFVLPAEALKKKLLFDGLLEMQEEGLFASLDVGPKFDLAEFLGAFGQGNLFRRAQMRVSGIEW